MAGDSGEVVRGGDEFAAFGGRFADLARRSRLFAMERHMDKISRVVGLAPEELRRRNFIQAGGTTATGQTIHQPIDLDGLMERALDAAGYHEKKKRFERENARSAIKRGVGFAAFMHGAGFTGSGERYLNALVGA